MPVTREQSRQVMDHLVQDFLDRGNNDERFHKALQQQGAREELESFLALRAEDIEDLKVPQQARVGTPATYIALNRGNKNLVRQLLAWLVSLRRNNNNERLTVEELLALQVGDFDDFRVDNVAFDAPANPAINPAVQGQAQNAHVQHVNHQLDPVRQELESFKRGVKRDPAVYPTLREDKMWDNWNRSLQAQARAHDVQEILDGDYVPVGDLAVQLFQQKQSFMYAVFNRVILTDMGKTLVRKHEHDYNAQAVYRELVAYFKKSTQADLTIGSMLQYFSNVKLDSRWTGNTQGFILHWCDRMRLYEDIAPVEERMNDMQKKRLLQIALYNVDELRVIQSQDEQYATANGQKLSYSAYMDLVLSAATRRDEFLKLPPQRNRRNVHMTTSKYGFDEADSWNEGYVDDGGSYLDHTTYDQGASNIAVNAHQRLFFPKDMWDSLPKDVQDFVLSSNKGNNSSNNYSSSTKPRPKPPHKSNVKPKPRFSNVHEVDYNYNYNDEDEAYLDHNGTETPEHIDNVATTHNNCPDHTNNEDSEYAISVNQSERGNPGDIFNVLTSSSKSKHTASKQAPANSVNVSKTSSNNSNKDFVVVNGKRYYSANTRRITYYSHSLSSSNITGSLVDRGANGGIAGDDVLVLERSHRTCDVSGINNHTMPSLPIVTCAGLVNTSIGKTIVIMHEYAYAGKGSTIHSSAQLEHFGHSVNDRSVKVKGGKQQIVTPDGIVLPLDFRVGLPYLNMTKPTALEMLSYHHIVLTSDVEWQPNCLDHNNTDIMDGIFLDNEDEECLDNNIDYNINYSNSVIVPAHVPTTNLVSPTSFRDLVDTVVDVLSINKTSVAIKKPHYDALRPNFGWSPADAIKKTFECTTQWARMVERYPFRKHFKSRFPALNVIRRNEAVATDTVFSDTPAVASGCKVAQIFAGCKTFVVDIYPMKLEADFVRTLQDNIRERGAMTKLISDMAKVETSSRVNDILRLYSIQNGHSEPYHEHQNPAERRYQTVKRFSINIMERTGAPANTWLLAMQYACDVLNLTYVDKIDMTPMQALTGQTPDISILLCFTFWEPVYFANADALSYSGKISFPSQSAEDLGRFVGFGNNIGDALTFKILTDKTQRIIYRSSVRSVKTTPPNLRLVPAEGEITGVTHTNNTMNDVDNGIDLGPSLYSLRDAHSSADINPDLGGAELEYVEYPRPSNTSGNNTIQPSYTDLDTRLPSITDDDNNNINETTVEVEDSLGNVRDSYPADLVAYNDVLDHVEAQLDDMATPTASPEDKLWQFDSILAHVGPLQYDSPDYKGSKYNVLIKWTDGSTTYEPLNMVAKDDPVTCAIYAKEHDLLDNPSWKRFKSVAKQHYSINKNVIDNIVNINNNYSRSAYKAKSYSKFPVHKFGFQVPRSVKETYEIDRRNGNTKWTDAIATEINQIQEYQTFKSLGKQGKPPDGYKRIRVHFVFDVKHDGRHKARLVADGHLTEEPTDSIYSGVVSLRSLRLVVFLGELNGQATWGADVGNAYLESYTKERVYIIAGPEFGDLEGHTLLVDKALYGLRSSGLCWHERFADTLRDMGYKPSRADADVWMRSQGDCYEYIAVYVDDLAIVSKDPKAIIDTLTNKYKYKLKGVGAIDYHLGANFGRDGDGTLRYGPRKYIDKLMDSYKSTYGELPTARQSPLPHNDHPETDDSPELDEQGIKQYQSMIGALQWTVTLGRFDILAAVMTMSRFRIAPRVGHLDRLKRIYGYLRRYNNGNIRFRTGEPDYGELEYQTYDWSSTVYGTVAEDLPDNQPLALGNSVTTTTYVDANLMHCLITGRASTGILHLVNGTPIEWYSKRQATVETATYGSEFVAARIATDQVIDLKLTLAYLGVNVKQSVMFGDNQSVVTSSTIPHSKLNKRHIALSYHRVREAIASGVLSFHHINGKSNPADMLSKHAGYQQFWPMLRSLLFWGVSVERSKEEEDKTIQVAYERVGSET